MNANDKWWKLNQEVVNNLAKKQRLGQAYMNALYSVDKDLYMKINEVGFGDCFYDDNLIQRFLSVLSLAWSE
jgi:hypothetical protein